MAALPSPSELISRVWKALLDAAPFRQWAQVAGAAVLTVAYCANTWIVWRGGWSVDTEAQRLELLGWNSLILGGLILINLLAITDLAVNLNASRKGVHFSASADEDRQEARPLAASHDEAEDWLLPERERLDA